MGYSEESKTFALVFVAVVRSRTRCAICRRHPIDWHRPNHRHNDRPIAMAARGLPIARINEEIGRCTPLCRRCHMTLDGRTKLSTRQVRAIATSTGRARDVASRYGISRKYVEWIRRVGRRPTHRVFTVNR